MNRYKIMLVYTFCLAGIFLLVFISPQLKGPYRGLLGIILFFIGLVVSILEFRKLTTNTFQNNEENSNLSTNVKTKRFELFLRYILLIYAISGTIWALLINTYIAKYLAFFTAYAKQEVEKADAIVVMASGSKKGEIPSYTMFTRILHGFKLLKQNKAPILILNASSHNENRSDDIKATHELAELLGIPKNKYIVFSKDVFTTRTEVRSLSKFLKENNYKRVIVVTDNLHMLRTMLMFKACGIQAYANPVQELDLIETARDTRLELFNALVHEWLGLVLYWFRSDFSNCN